MDAPARPSDVDGGSAGVDGGAGVDAPTLRAVPSPPGGQPDSPRLNQRVPQAHLAAGLRREAQNATEPAPQSAVRDPGAARDALTRFQASQRQAREAVRRGHVPDSPEGAE